MNNYVLQCLNTLNPSELNYSEWVECGMALKFEGYSASDWDDWSARDTARYHRGECTRKWETFHELGKCVTGGTIIYMCQARGILPDVKRDFTDWHRGQEIRTYLEALFEPSDIVNIVTESYLDRRDGKYKPKGYGHNFKVSELLARLEKYGDDVGASIGDYNKKAGAWVRFNPMDGKGAGNENVTGYRYALVESDALSINEQWALYRRLELPVKALVHSGGKSLHAIVRIDAPDEKTYAARVRELFSICEENGLKIDRNNKNASRLSRLPGCDRGDQKQYLLETNTNAQSWSDWRRARGEAIIPFDYTDVGQANVFVSEYGNVTKYTTATNFLVYDGVVWEESETGAQLLSQTLTGRQLKEARIRVQDAEEKFITATAAGDVDEIKEAKAQLEKEETLKKFILSRRSSNKIKATLIESRPRISIKVEELDKDGFLLNTPDGTIDLRTGDMRPHVSTDYCTKLTTVSPGDENAEIFRAFLERVTVGDKDLERYLQEVAGMCAIGKVLRENLIIAYGEGGNGKSTLFNLLAHVLGDYSGMLSAETLTSNCRKNKSPEYAELRGKRLIIAAELEEGMRLDTAVVKKLCSTDPILAEKKYKDPFSFIPSHTVILYTNHLPKIGTSDRGTWDRIVAVPFLANFRGMKGEIKNYAEYLYEKCGGAVLTWIVEGAQRFISNEYNIVFPECVKRSIDQYRASNDWLQNFLDECCEIGSYHVRSGELYAQYRRYCDTTGEYRRAQRDFKQALSAAGFEGQHTRNGSIIFGLRVISDFDDRETPWGRASPDVG